MPARRMRVPRATPGQAEPMTLPRHLDPWLRPRLSPPGAPPSRFERLAFALAVLLLYAALVAAGARLGPDTASLAAGAVTHPPLYIWLLGAYNAAVAIDPPPLNPMHYRLLAALQVALALLAAWWLGRSLRLAFGLPRWAGALAGLALLAPVIAGDPPFGRTVDASALAYPLFLAVMACLLRGIAQGDWRWLIAVILLLPAALLTSGGLGVLVPGFVVVLAWVLWAYPGPGRPKAILAALLVGAVLTAALVERLNVYAEAGDFAPVPDTGPALLAAPLYLAEDADAALFRDRPERRRLFAAMRREMDVRNLRVQDLELGPVPAGGRVAHFQAARDRIVRRAVLPVLREADIAPGLDTDRETRHLAYRLLGDKPLAWLCLAFGSLVQGLGGAFPAGFLVLAFAVAAVAQARRRDPASLALASVLLFHLLNAAVAALIGADVRQAAAVTAPLTLVLLLVFLARALWPGVGDGGAGGTQSPTGP